MSPPRILVVDDNLVNMKLVSFILAKRGYEIATAENAAQTFASVREATPDLILLDLQLPEIDGYEIARRLRAEFGLHDTPIVAVTAFAMRGDEERALAAGCTAYMSKPIDTSALPGLVARLLGGVSA